VAGKIIADIIEAPFDSIKMNVANVTVLTANNSGLTYLPTGNVNINVGSTTSLSLGNVTVSNLITANGGIKFPATQVASADVNTLDDYEEGTWTPVVVFSGASTGITYTRQEGYYVKIGKQVTVSCHVLLSSKGSATGSAGIGGLPFTIQNTTNDIFCAALVPSNFTGITEQISLIAVDNTTTVAYYKGFNTGTNMTNSDFLNNSNPVFTMTYFTS
jgi:hypothetical protein